MKDSAKTIAVAIGESMPGSIERRYLRIVAIWATDITVTLTVSLITTFRTLEA